MSGIQGATAAGRRRRVALVGATGNELELLLAPLTAQEFVRDFWARKALFVKGFADKYAGFFDAAAFTLAISPPGPFPDDFLRASFDRKTGEGRSVNATAPDERTSSVFRATVDQAVPLYTAGATLCASQIETRVAPLATFLAAIKRQLGYPGKVTFNAYLSPPGSGFNWHFDARIASTLQIEGSKRWRYSRSLATAWPLGNGTMRADGAAGYNDPGVWAATGEPLAPLDEGDIDEVLLEPGDLLILPAGMWHEACGGRGGSLALNLSFNPLPYTHIVRTLLDTLLGGSADWRGPLPVLAAGAAGEADPAGIAALAAQLARAADVLGSLRGDSAAVVRLWQSLVQNPNPAGTAPSAAPPRPQGSPLEPQQRLRLRADGDFCAMLADGGTRLCIAIGTSRSVDLTGAALSFGQRILAERSFLAGQCLSWNVDGKTFAWSDVAALLAQLEREGLLERSAS